MTRLRMYDSLPPEEAIIRSVVDPGANPATHRAALEDLRRSMPLLHRAIMSLVDTHQNF